MSRVPKYRAWYKPLGVMIEPENLVKIEFETKVLGVYMEMDDRGYHQLRISDFELMEYTGMNDEDGEELYDGDLCTDDGISVLQILWSKNHQWGVKVLKGAGILTLGLTFPLWHWDECRQNGFRQLKKIGTVYENPELLGEAAKAE